MVLKKKKKKIKEETENSSGGVKFGKVSIKAVKAKVKEEESRKAGRSDNTYYKSPQGRRYLGILPPTSTAMNGMPTVDKLMHNNLGPEKNGFGQCQRPNLNKETRNDCRACRKSNSHWEKYRDAKNKKDQDRMELYKKKAMDLSVRAKPLAQIIDLTGAYDQFGKVVDKIPTCFGENLRSEEEKYNKCRRCPFLESCQKGVQFWELPFAASSQLNEKIGDEETDVTNIGGMIPMKVVRKGEGQKGTKYTIGWANEPIKLPSHLVSFLEKHAVDLTQKLRPSTDEEMLALMTGKKDEGENVEKSSGKSKKSDKKFTKKPRLTDKQRAEFVKKLKSNSEEKKKKSKAK